MLDSDKLDIVMLQSADMSTATKRLSRFYVVKGVIKYDNFASRVYQLYRCTNWCTNERIGRYRYLLKMFDDKSP